MTDRHLAIAGFIGCLGGAFHADTPFVAVVVLATVALRLIPIAAPLED